MSPRMVIVSKLLAPLVVGAVALGIAGFGAAALPMYWDENWYVDDARAILHPGLPITSPEHPVLGKMIIALCIALFGDSPGAWRAPSLIAHALLCGLVVAPFVSERAGRVLGLAAAPVWVAVVPGLVLAFDPLMFTKARVATLDSQIALAYSAAALLFVVALKSKEQRVRWLIACSVASGAALAIKWTALTLLPAFGLLALAAAENKRRLRLPLRELAALFVPGGLVYLGAFALSGASPAEMLRAQWQMISFHTVYYPPAHQWYASQPWEWLVATGAFWTSVQVNGDSFRAIIDLGAPLVWIPGLLAMITAGVEGVRRRDVFLLSLAVFPLMQLILWAFAARSTFIYYMTCILPFYALALGVWIAQTRQRAAWFAPALAACAITYFLALRPVLTAQEMTVEEAREYFDGPWAPFLINRRTSFELILERATPHNTGHP